MAVAGAVAESMDKVGAGAENKSFRHPTLHCSIPYCIGKDFHRENKVDNRKKTLKNLSQFTKLQRITKT